MIEREEDLAKLEVLLGPQRQVPLLNLRGRYRPVIIAGTRAQGEAS